MDWEMTTSFARTTLIAPVYYEVDPSTWADTRRVEDVSSCTITREDDGEVLERATLSIDSFEMGERWIRCYVDAYQDGRAERIPIGCWLVQTPRRAFDGLVPTLSCEAYSSLHPLREDIAPVGTCYPPGTNCTEAAAEICRQRGIAPVVESPSRKVLDDWYVVPPKTSWLKVANTLLAAADRRLVPDEYGRVCQEPIIDARNARPAHTFGEGDGSLLLPRADDTFDWYGLPNVCRVSCAGVHGESIVGECVNDDPNSILSTVSRGREVPLIIDSPDELKSGATEAAANLLARRFLLDASTVERVMVIRHGMVRTRLYECVRLSYVSAKMEADATIRFQRITVGGDDVEYEDTIVTSESLWEG